MGQVSKVSILAILGKEGYYNNKILTVIFTQVDNLSVLKKRKKVKVFFLGWPDKDSLVNLVDIHRFLNNNLVFQYEKQKRILLLIPMIILRSSRCVILSITTEPYYLWQTIGAIQSLEQNISAQFDLAVKEAETLQQLRVNNGML